jgi:hypothetical protein
MEQGQTQIKKKKNTAVVPHWCVAAIALAGCWPSYMYLL